MRLIDADRLKKKFCWHCEDDGKCKEQCFDLDIVDTTPTIDAVPVVRCKDCKHWKKDIFQIGDNFVGICRRKAAIKSEFPCTADGFCKWAKRRKA